MVNNGYSALPNPAVASSSSSSTSGAGNTRWQLPLPWSTSSSSGHNSGSASTSTPNGFDKPSWHSVITARPLRVALWLALSIFVIILVAGSTGHGPGSTLPAKIGSYASESWWRERPSLGQGWRNLPQNEDLLDPPMTKDPQSGMLMPPDVYPAALNPYKRANAALVALVRNGEKDAMQNSMRSVEAKFNRKFGYPWVFMNDEPFTEEFKQAVLSMTRSEVKFATIPKEHWSYPDWLNQTKAAEERQKMVDERVIYGGSESYRHMCRFNSGFFYRQKVLQEYDWYWRVEPGIELKCDVDVDPFLFMEANGKTYGFTIVLYEYERTIMSLWQTVKDFAREHPEYIAEDNAMRFMVDDPKSSLDESRYNLCHFWSNFEIADMRFWRSKAYTDFFDYLDSKGGFFYERWGDAPVHSIAAALFLPKEKIWHADFIAYRHNPYEFCPAERKKTQFFDNGKCECDPSRSMVFDGYGCYAQWFRAVGTPPEYKGLKIPA
ncbi:hypothetical protein OIO90_000366 [Microbotryomycetes sp. JL221]|nr:hypothetical protein OIO90_000366 [Microbotryomycetes sp. JL221]